MPVIVSLLRGVNVGGHHKIRMEALRALCEELGLRDVQTCGQSGNVVFRHSGRDLARLGKRIEDGIERSFGFRASVILRTAAELRDVIARNPFAKRPGIDPSKLYRHFSDRRSEPGRLARESWPSKVIPKNCGSAAVNSLSIFPTAWPAQTCSPRSSKRR